SKKPSFWRGGFKSRYPRGLALLLAGSGKALTTADVVVGPAAALARTRFGRAGDVIPTVLIVDDVHDYGPGTYAKALDDGYQWRLGLTAALERSDDLVESVLLPYFGTIIPGCDYARAVTDGLLPKIRVVQVEVQLTDAEATKLHQLEAQIEHLTDMLVGNYGAPDPHSSAFDKFVRSLAGGRYAAAQYAKKYLNAIADHTALLAECKAKSDLVRALPPALPDHTQMILFTDRASSAGHIARALTDQGLTAAISGVGAAKSDRDAVALGLREGTIRALVEPRTLDESLVVPEAGLGVILTSARSDRQMIQRMGRLIRPNRPHPIVFVVAIVQGTPEDPAQGSARSHLRLLWQIAERAAKTDASRAPDILRRMLRPDEPVDAETTTDTSANRSTSASPAVAATVRPSVPSNSAGAQRVPVVSSGSQQPAQPLAKPTSVPSATSAPVPEIAEPAPSNTMDPTFDMTVELVGQLHTQGGIATADEVGDLIGLTDPDDMRAVVAAAAAQGHLDFSPIEDGADELILLSAEAGGTPAQRRDAAAAVAEWAVRADDPIDEFHDLVTRLGPIRVCDHRLIQIAAFLRGTTPIALL
ncbi:DEAD/DEAH box helicase, partial [Nocardia cyriacigeorgica]|uniref:DEAD/DEAH box helicase n=1 Tax=Nocardia cyriacigeorgica TaxID=135487 RepID=UPI002455E1FC